jgi:hypothetical protein
MLPRAQLISIFRVRDGLSLPVGPWFSLGQELGELRVEHAELVVPRVAHDPELVPLCTFYTPPPSAPQRRHGRAKSARSLAAHGNEAAEPCEINRTTDEYAKRICIRMTNARYSAFE